MNTHTDKPEMIFTVAYFKVQEKGRLVKHAREKCQVTFKETPIKITINNHNRNRPRSEENEMTYSNF